MITEAIILAGGLGTRLRSAVPDLPKCLAPVAGRPFLHYIIRYYQKQGIGRFIFSLGYRHEAVEAFLREEFQQTVLRYAMVVEDEPLGTGGAVKKAVTMAGSGAVLVLNGDTFFAVEVSQLAALHSRQQADCTLSLKPMTDFDRYGAVVMAADGKVTSFREKQYYSDGLINGGVYALNANSFAKESSPEKFSFEKDYLSALYKERNFFGSVQSGYFIDIGIPEDFAKANLHFHQFIP